MKFQIDVLIILNLLTSSAGESVWGETSRGGGSYGEKKTPLLSSSTYKKLSPAHQRGMNDDPTRHTMPPNPKPYQVTYDDGTLSPPIHLVVKGDDDFTALHQIYEETLDGFTVQQVGGHYVYLEVDDDTGEYIETELVVGKDDPYSAHIRKDAASRYKASYAALLAADEAEHEVNEPEIFVNVDEGDEEYTPPPENNFGRKLRGAKKKEDQQQQQDHRRTVITSGTLKNLVIPVRFADHVGRTLPSRADLEILMSNEGSHPLCPTGSVRDVYLKNSFGALDLQNTVIDWITIDQTEAYCADGQSGGYTFHTCLINALDKAVASGVDFGDYDLDNNGLIDGITFFQSGYGAEWGGTDAYGTGYQNRIWSHKWSLSSFWSSSGVRVSTYHVSPGVWGTSGSAIGRIGVVAHETGHFLGLPDLYDYGAGNGIGAWGLMANSWGFDGSQYYPPLMSAWSKLQLGWVNPTVASTTGSYSLRQSCDYSDMIRIDRGYPSGQYLLIENRQDCSYDSRIPQGGLAIFYIDDNANNVRGYPGQSGWPGNGDHYEVALLQADGNYSLERGSGRGDNDLFHGNGVNSIGPDGTSAGRTYPNTKPYQISDHTIDLTISNISQAGGTMTLDITFGPVPTPSPVPITAAPVGPPTNAFCGNGVCEVSEGEGCGSCPSDCFFSTHCNVVGNSGGAVYGSSTFGIVFDATVGPTSLYFYELQVWLMNASANAKVYMKSGSYTSDSNVLNWTKVFDGSLTRGASSRANIEFQSRFYAAAGSTVAFYISYEVGGAFVYSRNSASFANADVTVQSGNAVGEQTGNTLPSTVFAGRDFLDDIKYDYGTSTTSAPVASTSAPTKSPSSSPVKSPTAVPTKAPTSSPTKSPTSAPTKSPVTSTLAPVASTPAPVTPTQAPVASPTSTCSCCEDMKSKMDNMEAMLQAIMNILQSSTVTSSPVAPTAAPVASPISNCIDKTGSWTIRNKTRSWCVWVKNGNTATRCRVWDLYDDCPSSCSPDCA